MSDKKWEEMPRGSEINAGKIWVFSLLSLLWLRLGRNFPVLAGDPPKDQRDWSQRKGRWRGQCGPWKLTKRKKVALDESQTMYSSKVQCVLGFTGNDEGSCSMLPLRQFIYSPLWGLREQGHWLTKVSNSSHVSKKLKLPTLTSFNTLNNMMK